MTMLLVQQTINVRHDSNRVQVLVLKRLRVEVPNMQTALLVVLLLLSIISMNTIHAFSLMPSSKQFIKYHSVVSSVSPTVPSTSTAGISSRLYSTADTTTEEETTTVVSKTSKASSATSLKKKASTIGLLTFDLDDTIYPLAPVISEANAAFAKAMERYGFPNIQSNDITKRSVQIRNEIAAVNPQQAATLSHTEIRKLAIRKEMELVMFNRKLNECAIDWATNVESLGPAVVTSARKWSSKAVSSSVVEAVLTAWEMERHHAAERHLYVEVLPALKQIKKEHPNVIIGAVTDGKANPKFMTFTLAQYFDFCINWEDDQGGRRKFFQELSKVEGNAELTWIYKATYEKGRELYEAAAAIRDAKNSDDGSTKSDSIVLPPFDDTLWIHVGDDLAYDVGGSAQCGAKTVFVELADKYGQTARHRFTPDHININTSNQPEWSVASIDELKARAVMNQAALEYVDERLEYWHLLPETINKILDDSS